MLPGACLIVVQAGGKFIGRRPEAPVIHIVDRQQADGGIDPFVLLPLDLDEVVVDIGGEVEAGVGTVAGAGADFDARTLRHFTPPANFAPGNRLAEVQDGRDIGGLVHIALTVDFELGDFVIAQGKGAQREPASGLDWKAQIDDRIEVFAGGFQDFQVRIAVLDPAQIAQYCAPFAGGGNIAVLIAAAVAAVANTRIIGK